MIIDYANHHIIGKLNLEGPVGGSLVNEASLLKTDCPDYNDVSTTELKPWCEN